MTEMSESAQIIGSIITGTSISSILARAFIAKSLRDVESVVKKIGEINTQLAAISVHLSSLEKTDKLLRDIDRKVAALETRVYGKPKRDS